MKPCRRQRLFVIILISLALSGCGGGGGGSHSLGAPPPDETPPGDTPPTVLRTSTFNISDYVEEYLADTNHVRDELNNIRTSVAKTGDSDTYSTNMDGSGNTRDSVNVEITGDPGAPMYKLTYQPDAGASAVTVFDFNAGAEAQREADTQFDATYDYLASRSLNLQYLADGRGIDIDGDSNDDGRFGAVVYSTYNAMNDTDYFAGGFWLYAPDGGDIVVGTFSDGTPQFTNIAGLTGTATYRGSAVGIISLGDPDSDVGRLLRLYEIDSDIELNATFGATPKISGALRNIVQSEAPDNNVYQIEDIMLAEADIQNDGTFTAPLAGVSYTTTQSGVSAPLEGSWGGRFYGNNADFVGGSVVGGGDSDGGTAYPNNLFMVYTAEKTDR